MAPNDEEYKHKELQDQSSLRILRLHPAENHDDPTVAFKVFLIRPNDRGDKSKVNSGRYEALSWCWGDGVFDRKVTIFEGEETSYFMVSDRLFEALQALRYPRRYRYLWVDAICIDQNNPDEKNKQVPRMHEIYGGAENVCIWLGPNADKSELAIEFIRHKVLDLWNFDTLCSDKDSTDHWWAFGDLMKRPWFSRRWIVQEIALAKKATVHCGKDSIPWDQFANAIALLVETESVSKRLSEIFRGREEYGHIPQLFDYVPALGAARLVEATGLLFRTSPTGERERLSTLENLVSRLPIFATGEPRDTIYALLAMASDANPKKESTNIPNRAATRAQDPSVSQSQDLANVGHIAEVKRLLQKRTRTWLDEILSSAVERRPWLAAMALSFRKIVPPSDLSDDDMKALLQHLVSYSPKFRQEAYPVNYEMPVVDIYRQFIEFTIRKSDQTRALDIICRPWARRVFKRDEWRFLKKKQSDGKIVPACQGCSAKELGTEIDLPSWIPKVGGAAFGMAEERRRNDAPNQVHVATRTTGDRSIPRNDQYFKMGMKRQNADTLVGNPDMPFRNYTAAGTRSINRRYLRFRKRPDHYSMTVQGFVLDDIKHMRESARKGIIPNEWRTFIGWTDVDTDPSETTECQWNEFWRTLVADRGPNGVNTPRYYELACKTVMRCGSGAQDYDTTQLINDGQCTIIAEFLRRVQATIWNKRLIKSNNLRRLGLVSKEAKENDKICIIYGCSVPVILREHTMSEEQAKRNREYDEKELAQLVISRAFRRVQSRPARERAERDARRRAFLPVRKPKSRSTQVRKVIWRRLYVAHTKMYWFLLVSAYAAMCGNRNLASSLLLGMSWVSAIALLPHEASDIVHQLAIWSRKLWLAAQRPEVERTRQERTEDERTENTVDPEAQTPQSAENEPRQRTGLIAQSIVDFVANCSISAVELACAFSLTESWSRTVLEALLFVALSALFDPHVIPANVREMAKGMRRQAHNSVAKAMKKVSADGEAVPSLRYYEFIGEAYIHGMMNGEAISEQNARKIPTETFELR